MKISKRDVKIFLLGMLAMLVLEALYDWKNTVTSVKEGFNDGWNGYHRSVKK